MYQNLLFYREFWENISENLTRSLLLLHSVFSVSENRKTVNINHIRNISVKPAGKRNEKTNLSRIFHLGFDYHTTKLKTPRVFLSNNPPNKLKRKSEIVKLKKKTSITNNETEQYKEPRNTNCAKLCSLLTHFLVSHHLLVLQWPFFLNVLQMDKPRWEKREKGY